MNTFDAMLIVVVLAALGVVAVAILGMTRMSKHLMESSQADKKLLCECVRTICVPEDMQIRRLESMFDADAKAATGDKTPRVEEFRAPTALEIEAQRMRNNTIEATIGMPPMVGQAGP